MAQFIPAFSSLINATFDGANTGAVGTIGGAAVRGGYGSVGMMLVSGNVVFNSLSPSGTTTAGGEASHTFVV